jgi:hypothetical protein
MAGEVLISFIDQQLKIRQEASQPPACSALDYFILLEGYKYI